MKFFQAYTSVRDQSTSQSSILVFILNTHMKLKDREINVLG